MRSKGALCVGLSTLSWGCSGSAPTPVVDEGPVEVVALSEVAHWAARSVLLADAAEVRLLPPVGADPGSWQPTGEQVAEAAQADLIVANGAGYEAWAKTAALPAGRMVFLTDGVILLEREGAVHSHGSEGAHSHGVVDAHTWMDLASLSRQVEGLAAEVERMHPGLVDAAALETLTEELKQLDTETDAVLAPLKGLTIATSHPVYGYLARRHGLELVELDLAADAAPDGDEITLVRAWAESQPVDLLWWEERPVGAAFQPLGGGIHHVIVDPLETGEGGLDLVVQARRNLSAYGEGVELLPQPDKLLTAPPP